jgi:nicotinate-nucleotide adenylyltransferase
MDRRIGLFGGTYDPVHNGHISAAESFLNSKLVDSLWILLNPAPPHKSEADFAPYSCRLKMLRKAFNFNQRIKISDVETRLPKPCYTVQTLRYLTESYPDSTFYLCIGYDSFASFQSWYEWEQILKLCTLLVVNRPSGGAEPKNDKLLDNAVFIEHQPMEVSSSEIRTRIAEGKPITRLVPHSVEKFIKEERLYE